MTPISVIIPALNEAKHIGKAIMSARGAFEVIVADGGSVDGTAEVAGRLGARVVSSLKGRAAQMNTGADAATGGILLFLHADTVLPDGYGALVRDAINGADAVAGAFTLRIDSPLTGLRAIERLANWRARRFNMPYGDQAIFIRAETFREARGFPDMPVMEDFELMRRVRRMGRVEILSAPAVTSARRWVEAGVLKTTLINQAIIIGYTMGVSPSILAGWRVRKGS